MKYTLPPLYFLLFALPMILSAQANKQVIHKEFTAFSLTSPIGKISYMTEGEAVAFRVNSFKRSKVQTYKGPPMITFFRGGLDEDGKPVDIIAKTRLKKGLKRPLLLFAETDNNYTIIQIEDDMASSPAGSIRFMNLSDIKQELFIGIGETAEVKKQIQPAGIATYKITDEDIGNLRIRVARRTEDGAEIMKDMRIFPEKVNRYIYFIFQPDLKKKRITMKMLVEKSINSRGELSADNPAQ